MAHWCFWEGCTEIHCWAHELAMGSASFVHDSPLMSGAHGKSDPSRWVFTQRLKEVISIAIYSHCWQKCESASDFADIKSGQMNSSVSCAVYLHSGLPQTNKCLLICRLTESRSSSFFVFSFCFLFPCLLSSLLLFWSHRGSYRRRIRLVTHLLLLSPPGGGGAERRRAVRALSQ